jgi:hypothetical protein
MTTLSEKQAAASALADQRKKDAERVFAQFAEVFKTDTGREVFSHLWRRFDVEGRAFLTSERGEVNALRAAVRDGERAAIKYILTAIRRADPTYQTPTEA